MEVLSTQVALNAMELDEIPASREARKHRGGLSSDAGRHVEEEPPKLHGNQEIGVMGA